MFFQVAPARPRAGSALARRSTEPARAHIAGRPAPGPHRRGPPAADFVAGVPRFLDKEVRCQGSHQSLGRRTKSTACSLSNDLQHNFHDVVRSVISRSGAVVSFRSGIGSGWESY